MFIKLSLKDQTRLDKLANYDPNKTIKLNITPWWQSANIRDFNYTTSFTDTKISIQEACYLPTGEYIEQEIFDGEYVKITTPVFEWDKPSPLVLSPFDIVALDDRSNLSSDILNRIYSGETVLDGLKVMPAAATHYVEVKRRNETIEELTYIATDVLAMAVGIGELSLAAKALSKSRKIVAVIDVLNSAANIAVNTTELQNDETVEKWLQIYNIAAVFNNFAAGYRGGKNLLNAGARKLFSTPELALLERADLKKFVEANLDDLLILENRNAICDLNNIASGQFKRGDLIEEIFNQWDSKYGNYLNLNDIIPNYRTLDFDGVLADTREVVSLKSYKRTDESISTLKNTLKGYTEKLNDDITINTNHSGKKRVLDFVIEKEAWTQSQIDDIFDYIEDVLLPNNGNVDEIRISPF